MKKTIILIITILIIGIIACNSNKQTEVLEKFIPVKLVSIDTKDISIPIHSSGRLYPESISKLSFKTGGLIKKLYVKEGDTIKKGVIIAELDLSEINAYYSQAKNGLEKAKRDMIRVGKLYKDKAATIEQNQNVKTAYDIALSNLKIAKFNLKHSKIKAPQKGKILKKFSEENEMISAGHPVYLFGSTNNDWIIKAGVSEKDLLKVKLNDRAEIKLSAYDNKFSGIVYEISDSLDQNSGTYELKIKIIERDVKFVTGFIASVDIFPSYKRKLSLIPYDSLIDSDGNNAYIFTIEKNIANKKMVKIIHLFKDKAGVIFKSKTPVKIVSDGAPYLVNGTKVKIIK